MQIAELFVNLGIKGTEKTVGALSTVKKGLGDISSMSLEAKAGILAALYGLERLTAASGAAGTNFTNFTALTGMSAQALQRWQYAARQAGISGQEMEGSLKGVQNAMTNMLLGNGMPAGFGIVASKVGLDMTRLRDTQYVMAQLQKFAQQVPADVASNVIKSFGVGEGVIAAMRRNSFRPDVFAKAPAYSDKEIGALDKANIAWSNLGQKIEMAIGHFNAKHGLELVRDITVITDKVLKLSEAFMKLADQLKLFSWVSKVFEGWSLILDQINATAKDLGNKGAAATGAGALDTTGSVMKQLMEDWKNWILTGTTQNNPNLGTNQNIQINQNLNFQHDGRDAKKTGDSVHESTKKAFRQMPAQRKGS